MRVSEAEEKTDQIINELRNTKEGKKNL